MLSRPESSKCALPQNGCRMRRLLMGCLHKVLADMELLHLTNPYALQVVAPSKEKPSYIPTMYMRCCSGSETASSHLPIPLSMMPSAGASSPGSARCFHRVALLNPT